jgi:two-component system, OmpR family, response regulator
MSASARVLVVDDEPSIVDAVATSLRYEGFEVLEATTGHEGLHLARTASPALIILDVMLPDVDGFEIARTLRREGETTPVLFLTAKDALDDKVEGFTAGADDYVTKPFSLAEVILRVHAIIGRTAGAGEPEMLAFSDIEMNTRTHEVQRAGTPITLTATEFKLLRYFLSNPRLVLSKTQILDHVWEYDFDGDSNVVETYVSYLRKKLNALGPPLIHTIRLVGYTMRVTEQDT